MSLNIIINSLKNGKTLSTQSLWHNRKQGGKKSSSNVSLIAMLIFLVDWHSSLCQAGNKIPPLPPKVFQLSTTSWDKPSHRDLKWTGQLVFGKVEVKARQARAAAPKHVLVNGLLKCYTLSLVLLYQPHISFYSKDLAISVWLSVCFLLSLDIAMCRPQYTMLWPPTKRHLL